MAVAFGSSGPFGALNGYWGQHGSERLADYCDSGIEYVTLAFVNQAPENNPSGYPGTNFAGHCWAGTYNNTDNVPSNLLSNCMGMKEDITYCQSQGVKILLSIGGEYNDDTNNYRVTTEDNGRDFAEFLYNAFGPYNPDWTGPRPFDSETRHTEVDGWDFDIEHALPNKPYMAMIDKFRELDSTKLIAAAPQCPTDLLNFYLRDMIKGSAFDLLFVQFYNNAGCDAIPGILPWDRFNYNSWLDVLAASDYNQDTKLFIGLPASTAAANSGYIEPEAMKDLVCQYKDKPNFGGISLWDLTRGAANVKNGKDYNQHALDALKYGCDPVPTPVPTTTSSSSSSAFSSSTTVSTPVQTTPSPTHSVSTPSVSPTDAESTSTSDTVTSSVSSIHSSFPSLSIPHNWNTTTTAHGASTTSHSQTTSFSDEDTTSQTQTSTSDSATITEPPTTTMSTAGFTTSTSFTTITKTITDCPPYVVDCPADGYMTTIVVPVYTTVCPITDVPEPTHTNIPNVPGNDWTTSTMYITQTKTITDCGPDVECPEGGIATTEVIVSTTICPVEPTSDAPSPPGDDDDHDDEPNVDDNEYDDENNWEDNTGDHPGHGNEEIPGKPTVTTTIVVVQPTQPGEGGWVSVTKTNIPTGGLPTVPSASQPTIPVEAGAAGMTVGVAGLAAALALQLLM